MSEVDDIELVSSPTVNKKRKASVPNFIDLSQCLEPIPTTSDEKLEQIISLLKSNGESIKLVNERLNKVEEDVRFIKENVLSNGPKIDDQVSIDRLVAELSELKENVASSSGNSTNSSSTQILNPTLNLKDIVPDYDSKVKERNSAYWRYITNKERYEFHKKWLEEGVFVPPKYVPKKLKYPESDRMYNLRKQDKISRWECDIEMFLIQRDEAKAKFESVDSDMNKYVSELDIAEEVRKSLESSYKAIIKAEESKSDNKCLKVHKDLEEMPNWGKNHVTNTEERNYRTFAEAAKTNTEKVDTSNNQWKTAKGKNKKNFTPVQNTVPVLPMIQYPYHNVSVPPPSIPVHNSFEALNQSHPSGNFYSQPKANRWKK